MKLHALRGLSTMPAASPRRPTLSPQRSCARSWTGRRRPTARPPRASSWRPVVLTGCTCDPSSAHLYHEACVSQVLGPRATAAAGGASPPACGASTRASWPSATLPSGSRRPASPSPRRTRCHSPTASSILSSLPSHRRPGTSTAGFSVPAAPSWLRVQARATCTSFGSWQVPPAARRPSSSRLVRARCIAGSAAKNGTAAPCCSICSR
mmetsp:Transcript_32778/g.104568  ORF Transcript_32778/g.104568 Transcript_32778/m.104568 type:complete len:209 (-) Transcript_32778:241-867(-)